MGRRGSMNVVLREVWSMKNCWKISKHIGLKKYIFMWQGLDQEIKYKRKAYKKEIWSIENSYCTEKNLNFLFIINLSYVCNFQWKHMAEFSFRELQLHKIAGNEFYCKIIKYYAWLLIKKLQIEQSKH